MKNLNSCIIVLLTSVIISACNGSKVLNQNLEGDGLLQKESLNGTFTNPLLDNGADPWAIYHDGNYYYIKSEGTSIVLLKTPDITDLRNAQSQIIWTAPKTGDHSKNIWAPEIHYINNSWYVYVAADDGDNRNHRMFVLENTDKNPFVGTFNLKSKLKTDANDNWAIDGSIFQYNNQFYFLWSGWENPKTEGGEETQHIYIAKMSNPWTISSERVLLSTPTLNWEKNYAFPGVWEPNAPVYVNEGPQAILHGKKLHIIYSASGCWTPNYALGLITMNVGGNLMNPSNWTKSKEPIFQQSQENGVYGTGHNSFFKSPDGTEDWILYHANNQPTDGCSNKRSPRAQKINWSTDDMPIIGIPYPTSKRLAKPSSSDIKNL
tara:strand:- start:26222 stop:27352 length:1131 start_codon:yes stop_codon:yes gene_type:complete